jgi:hypothetical protein
VAPSAAPIRPGRALPLGESDDGRATQPAPSLDKPT